MRRQEFAAIHTRLDGAESSQDAHLLHVAHDWHYVQPLELRINRVEATNQVLEEHLESLR